LYFTVIASYHPPKVIVGLLNAKWNIIVIIPVAASVPSEIKNALIA
jgi:hypothetical protein|tara:strand:+ start:1000 stop:1137 length:138 start_codon:yes stop_codon:yes gene_type:complete